MQFDDATVAALFGAEAAEDEEIEKLRSYFFRNKAYTNIRADLPLRILVGHKGIGKSALLKVSFAEDGDNNNLAIWLQPNDVHFALDENYSFIRKVEEIKILIARRIVKKCIEKFELGAEDTYLEKFTFTAAKVVSAAVTAAQKRLESGSDDLLGTLAKNFVKSNLIRIYIDDVDRGWRATKTDIENISALINACRDLTNEDRRLQFRIGLRTDAYFLVRTSDESTDKIEGNVVRLSWDNHEILVVVAKRVATYFGKQIDENSLTKLPQAEIAREMKPVLTERFLSKGHWDNAPIHRVLLSLVRRRPRDMIKLLSGAAREAYRNGSQIINTYDLEATFGSYSNERIQDLILEFKSELPDIDKLLYNMRPTSQDMKLKNKKSVYSNDELITKIKNIQRSHNFYFTNGDGCNAVALAEFLYKIDFIIARKETDDGSIDRKYFDQNRMLQSQFVDFGYDWEVHPAYRWALQPQSAASVLSEIDSLAE